MFRWIRQGLGFGGLPLSAGESRYILNVGQLFVGEVYLRTVNMRPELGAITGPLCWHASVAVSDGVATTNVDLEWTREHAMTWVEHEIVKHLQSLREILQAPATRVLEEGQNV